MNPAPPGADVISLGEAFASCDATAADTPSPIAWTDLVTSDAEQQAAMQQRVAMQYNQMDRGAFVGRFRELVIDGVTIASEQHNRTVLKRQYSPPDACGAGVIRHVAAPGRFDVDTCLTGHVGYAPGGREYEALMPPGDVVFFQFDQRRLMEAAETLGCALPGQGRDALFVNGHDPGAMLGLADRLLSTLGTGSADARRAVDAGYVGRLVVSSVVDAVASMSGRTVLACSSQSMRTVRRAHALLVDADRPLTVIDLCRELKVSRATLQRSFEQAYGIPPLAYMRMHRLNAARRALVAARGTAATVTSVAMNWGFFHLARFASDYRAQFGELPSATLAGTSRRP